MTKIVTDNTAFEEQILNLRVDVTRSADGIYTACSYSEPLFCYDAHDLESLEGLVQNTIRSYGAHFYGIPDPQVSTKRSPVGKCALPIEARGESYGTLQPVFDQAA
jgi:hypothetical protein